MLSSTAAQTSDWDHTTRMIGSSETGLQTQLSGNDTDVWVLLLINNS